MRLWLQYYANSAFAPSAALSVAAHVAFIGAAVYGSGSPAARDEPDEPLSSRAFYLPPPDRIPNRDAVVEHLQYVEVGAGLAALPLTSAGGTPVGRPASDASKRGGGSAGTDAIDHAAQLPTISNDSVFSILTVEESAVRAEGSAAPIYPREMLEQSLEGSVLARYVIDTTGRADSTTLEVVRATNVAFARAVREAIPGMRFSPASVQGHKVRQLVEQNFEFHIMMPAPVSAPAEHTRTKPVP